MGRRRSNIVRQDRDTWSTEKLFFLLCRTVLPDSFVPVSELTVSEPHVSAGNGSPNGQRLLPLRPPHGPVTARAVVETRHLCLVASGVAVGPVPAGGAKAVAGLFATTAFPAAVVDLVAVAVVDHWVAELGGC